MIRRLAGRVIALLLLVACADSARITEPAAKPTAPSADVLAGDVCDGVYVSLSECGALVALYNSTNGPGWDGFPSTEDWATATNPCTDWYGVFCENAEFGPVTLVKLQEHNLTGPIPPEIANLTSLGGLDLSANNVSGEIPAGLGSLTELRGLALIENDLTGSIPASLGNASSLRRLLLTANQLSGAIPPVLGQLPALVRLNAGNNQLSGSIPSTFGSAPQLVALALQRNQLSGLIPSELGSADKLLLLDLSNNQLTGLIPLGVAQLGGRIEASEPSFEVSIPRCDLTENAGLYLPDVQTYRDADLDQDGLICGLGFTAVAEVGDDAVDSINDLVPDPLTAGLANALTSKIENAIAKADAGHYAAAINQMQAFIAQLKSLVADGTLTEAQAAPFVEQAEELITIWTGLL